MSNSTQPMTPLPHINDVEPRSADDEVCFRELRAVLEKHGKLGRFGVCLLHQHFPMQDNELLVEECDEEARTLVIRPAPTHAPFTRNSIQTQWRLDGDVAVAKCIQVCTQDRDGKHTGKRSHL